MARLMKISPERVKTVGIYTSAVLILVSAVVMRFRHHDSLKRPDSERLDQNTIAAIAPSSLGGSESRAGANSVIDPNLQRRPPDELRRTLERSSATVAAKGKILTGPEYETFDDEGLLSRSLLELAGIDPSRTEELNDLIAQLRNTISSSMASRATFVGNEPRNKGIARVFQVQSSPDAAEENARTIESTIAEKFGSGAARILLPYLTKPEYLGGIGKYSIKLEFIITPMKSGSFGRVKYFINEPDSEKNIVEGSIGNIDGYSIHFGKLLAEEATADFWSGMPKSR